jgi:hypothetical protein
MINCYFFKTLRELLLEAANSNRCDYYCTHEIDPPQCEDTTAYENYMFDTEPLSFGVTDSQVTELSVGSSSSRNDVHVNPTTPEASTTPEITGRCVSYSNTLLVWTNSGFVYASSLA